MKKLSKAGLEWLDEHKEADPAEVKEKQKSWEEEIRPVLMKLYAAEAGKGDPASAAAAGAEGTGPRVEEVD